MKKFLISLVALLSFTSIVHAQCPTGDLLITGQNDIDNFITTYPNCKEIEGNVTIQSTTSNVSDLIGLSNITKITKNLSIIDNPALESFSGIENIINIGGHILIDNNQTLKNIGFPEDVYSYGSDIIISNNPTLESITGFNNKEYFFSDLNISNNNNLKTLTILEELTWLQNNITIANNLSLNKLSILNKLKHWSGIVMIENNESLTKIPGFKEVIDFTGNCKIVGNKQIDSIDMLNKVPNVEGYFSIDSNPMLKYVNIFQETSSYTGYLYLSVNPFTTLSGLNKLPKLTGDLTFKGITNQNILQCFQMLNEIKNTLSLYNSNITTNSLLPILKTVRNLTIESNDSLSNLNLFSGIDSITMKLDISYNPTLVDLHGLKNLRFVNLLYLYENVHILSLNGLDSLEGLGGTFIENNDAFIDLKLLSKFKELTGGISLINNKSLKNLEGLENIESLGGELVLSESPLINSLIVLTKLKSVGDWFTIKGLENITTLDGLNNLKKIKDLELTYNSKLVDVSGLNNLLYIYNSVYLVDNPLLTNITFLKNIKELKGDLFIELNNLLLNLNGLDSLKSVGATIVINYNKKLSDINGIKNISYINQLNIYNNKLLSFCAVKSVCDYLDIITSPYDANIYNNGDGCNSQEQVLEDCGLVPTFEFLDDKVTLFPNPTSGILNINSKDPEFKYIDIIDCYGSRISNLLIINNQLDISNLSSGLYYLELINGDKRIIKKVIKQ